MLYIIWKDYDGYYTEKFDDRNKLSIRLLEIARKEGEDEYGVEIIMVASAAEIDYEYKLDDVNNVERLYLDGEAKIINKHLKPEKEKLMKCPFCGKPGKKGYSIRTFVPKGYSSLDHYTCNSCKKEFYI